MSWMKEKTQNALSLTYGHKEDQILKEIKQLTDAKILSKMSRNEFLRRGIYSTRFLAEIDEKQLLVFLSRILHSLSKQFDITTLIFAKDMSYATFATMISKEGISKAESFETIPLTLDSFVQVLTKEKIDSIKDQIQTEIENLAISIDTVFLANTQFNELNELTKAFASVMEHKNNPSEFKFVNLSDIQIPDLFEQNLKGKKFVNVIEEEIR